jgi:hypothetical protein
MPDLRAAAATHKRQRPAFANSAVSPKLVKEAVAPKIFLSPCYSDAASLRRASGHSIAYSAKSRIVALRVIKRACRYVLSQQAIVIALGDLLAVASQHCVLVSRHALWCSCTTPAGTSTVAVRSCRDNV